MEATNSEIKLDSSVTIIWLHKQEPEDAVISFRKQDSENSHDDLKIFSEIQNSVISI